MAEKEAKKVKAVVTRAVAYGESDMILTLVSLEEGRLTATAKGCLKPKAKLRYAAQPFNFGEYMLASGKGGRYIVAECAQIDAFSPVTEDIEKYYAAAFVLEVLDKLSREAQPRLFAAAVNTLKDLAYSDCPSQDAVRDFLLGCLYINGSLPDFSHCAACRCDLSGGAAYSVADGILCEDCARMGEIGLGATGTIKLDARSRAYLAGEVGEFTENVKKNANMFLCELIYVTLGVRVSKHYFTEPI